MDENIRINYLMDFYGAMLTPRQQNAMQRHYEDDLSLGEIAQMLKISRQAVHDSIKRSVAQLEMYEQKLNLLQRYFDIHEQLEIIAHDAKILSNDNKEASRLLNKINALLDTWEN